MARNYDDLEQLLNELEAASHSRDINHLQSVLEKLTTARSNLIAINKEAKDGHKFQTFNRKILLINEVLNNSLKSAKANLIAQKSLKNQNMEIPAPRSSVFMSEKQRAIQILHLMGYEFIPAPIIETPINNFHFLGVEDEGVEHKVIHLKHQDYLLRSHTTAFQSSFLNSEKANLPNFRAFHIGKVFRNETDKSHFPCFHQIDILFRRPEVSCSSLIAEIKSFLERFFEQKVNIALKPSHFPFTTPSFEVYIQDVEIAGAGLVSVDILKQTKQPLEQMIGAAGIGFDRLIMLKHNIEDIRSLWHQN